MKFSKCTCDCETCSHQSGACLKFATERVGYLGVVDNLCGPCFENHQRRVNFFRSELSGEWPLGTRGVQSRASENGSSF